MHITIADFVKWQKEWSIVTFGPGKRSEGVLKHIESEIEEVRAEPTKLEEWIDVVILALDGAWRAGYTPEEVEAALIEKSKRNRLRTFSPFPPEDEPSFHVKGE